MVISDLALFFPQILKFCKYLKKNVKMEKNVEKSTMGLITPLNVKVARFSKHISI